MMHLMTRHAVAAAVLACSLSTACMVARYEEMSSDKRRLRSGQEVVLVWPDSDDPAPTLFINYVSKQPTRLEDEAREVWAEIRPEAEQKSVRRVAVQPTVAEGRWWSFKSMTTTFFHGRGADGRWTEGDPGVSE